MPKTVVLPIDIQRGFDDASWGPRSNPRFEAHVAEALAAARKAGLPVWHVRHISRSDNPLRAGSPGTEFARFGAPRSGEPTYEKTVNSAFIGTTLEADLRAHGFEHVVMLGMTGDHCVSTSARMASNLGFQVTILGDATATHDRFDSACNRIDAETVQRVSLASLDREFANVITTASFVAELSRSSENV